MFVSVPECTIRCGIGQLRRHDPEEIAGELEVCGQKPSDHCLRNPKDLYRSPSERISSPARIRRKKSLLSDNVGSTAGDHRHVLGQDLYLSPQDDDHAVRRFALGADHLTIAVIENPIPYIAKGSVFYPSKEGNHCQIDLFAIQPHYADLSFSPSKHLLRS